MNKFILVCFFVLSSFVVSSCTNNDDSWKNKTVVKVDDYHLTTKEFSKRLARKLSMFDALSAKDSAIVKKAKSEIVEDFILEMISLKWAQKNSVLVRKEEMDKAINKIKKSYPDELSFKRELANDDMTYSEWTRKMRFTILQKLVFAKITVNLTPPTEEKMKDYYKKHRSDYRENARVELRQVVLESENNARRILRALQSGKKMAALAKKYSITPEGINGGVVGWIEKGTLSIFDKAFSMVKGQRSDVLKSDYGYHIFEVMAKRSATTENFDQVKDKIRAILLEDQQQQAYSQWIEKQLRESKIYKDSKLISSIEVKTNA